MTYFNPHSETLFRGQTFKERDMTMETTIKAVPVDELPTVNRYGLPVRILAHIPPYGWSMAHYENGRWNCHSVLNKDAQPTVGILSDHLDAFLPAITNDRNLPRDKEAEAAAERETANG